MLVRGGCFGTLWTLAFALHAGWDLMVRFLHGRGPFALVFSCGASRFHQQIVFGKTVSSFNSKSANHQSVPFCLIATILATGSGRSCR